MLKKKKKNLECKKKEQILDTKWQNNETGEMVWGIWPQRLRPIMSYSTKH